MSSKKNLPIEQLREEAEKGDSDAMYYLACRYVKENDDFDTAEEWYIKAAELGNTQAMSDIAYEYYYQCSDDIYEEKAIYWYTKLAELGHPHGMCQLAMIYNCQDKKKEAKEWYEKAVKLGYRRAELDEDILGIKKSSN
jgi:TPR repeat protein